MSHLQADPIDEIKAMIIKIKKFIIELGILLNKSERNNIRKRLNEMIKKDQIEVKKEDYLKS